MKRFMTVAVVAALFIVIFSPSVQEALLLFVIAGLVPGTAWQLSPSAMIAGLSFAMALALYTAYRQTRTIRLPTVEDLRLNRTTRRKDNASIWRRRNALRPKLKLLQ
ncbi:MAG TPA: hypothetical protein VM581_01380 [Magnetospirillaceae bacterium]|nr:hypothetical protein [Magnetospirillaceae bacterium]